MIASATFLALAMQCAPNIDPSTLHALVKTESDFNPFAIGVVGTPLARQPKNLEEALTAVKTLERNGFNFSIGLSQINKQHFDIKNVKKLFSPCENLRMGGKILTECYRKGMRLEKSEQTALKKAFSCYYSGNFTRGFKPDVKGTSYVQRVVNNSLIQKNNQEVKVPKIAIEEANNVTKETIVDPTINQKFEDKSSERQKKQSHGSWDVFNELS